MLDHPSRLSYVPKIYNAQHRLQGWLGAGMIGVILVSALFLGANRPVAWLMMAAGIGVGLLVQLLLDAVSPPRSDQQAAAAFPAIGFIAVLVWGWAQAVPGWAPTDWLHPVWRTVEVPGTIAIDPIAALHHVLRLASYGAAFWIAIRAASNRDRASRMVAVIAVFGTALAVYGLGSFVLQHNLIVEAVSIPAGELTASFVNRNGYATYAGFGLMANLTAWILILERAAGPDKETAPLTRHQMRRLANSFVRHGWIFAIGSLACALALALTQSRGGAAATLAGVAVFLAAYQRYGGIVGRIALIGMGLLFFILAVTSLGGLTNRLLATSAEDGRFAVYPTVLNAASDRLWLGHGLGGFHHAFREFLPMQLAGKEWNQAHNAYLENLFELGLPVTLLLYAVLLMIAVRVIKGTRTRRRDHVFPSLALGCITLAGFHSLVDFSLQMPATAALFAVLLGIGWSQSFSSRIGRGDGLKRRGADAALPSQSESHPAPPP